MAHPISNHVGGLKWQKLYITVFNTPSQAIFYNGKRTKLTMLPAASVEAILNNIPPFRICCVIKEA